MLNLVELPKAHGDKQLQALKLQEQSIVKIMVFLGVNY